MFLNYEQIISRNIIEDYNLKQFNDSSYNLTIKQIIDMDNNICESFVLKPQGMAYVVFNEKIKVPSDIIGFAHVKTSITKIGIMATNIGIIDSNYNGYISTLLINFGKSEHCLLKGDPALKVSFSVIEKPTRSNESKKNDDLPYPIYLNGIKKDITNLDDKFLNLNSVEDNVRKSLVTSFLKYGAIFTALGFIASTLFQVKNNYDKKNDEVLKRYEIQVSTVIDNNKYLQGQLTNYQTQLKHLTDSLNKKTVKIKH